METYLTGFGNHFSSEAVPGTLPQTQNSPQMAPRGLYAEQISGTAFTALRAQNQFSWLYRIFPSVKHAPFELDPVLTGSTFLKPQISNPNQMRWKPRSQDSEPANFLTGLRTLCGSGGSEVGMGCYIHLYSFNSSMGSTYFMNADGDFVIVPQKGQLLIKTEMGQLTVEPEEIAVIPKGIKFQINPLKPGHCSGYVGEIFGAALRLPELGPIGANGLAHRRHFLAPTASFEDQGGDFELVGKFSEQLWRCRISHSPLDVVAWHGTYYPYKYDLRLFNTINTVSFDHPDPSIFTVLTSPSETPGVANVDFVIFPPRWMVGEHSFRPPYFHRNCMSEYMGLIKGTYDAKTAGGFVPGGGSLHNVFSAHGPDADTFAKASQATLSPQKIENTMAFMFESRLPYRLTHFASQAGLLDSGYNDVWQGFKKMFTGPG